MLRTQAVDLDYEDIPESSEMPSNAAQGTVLGAIMLIIGSTIGAVRLAELVAIRSRCTCAFGWFYLLITQYPPPVFVQLRNV